MTREAGRWGWALVVAQVGLCVGLLWAGLDGMGGRPWLWAGVAVGAGVMVAALAAMRIGRLRIHPAPGQDAELVRGGIYRLIRHPMYAGLLLAGAMFACGGGPVGWGIWAGLGLVLWRKWTLEEEHWLERDESYADYQRRSKRLVPWVW